MKIKNKKDFGLGIFCILLAAFITYMSMGLKATGYEGDPGPKMFPMIGAVIIAVCGIGVIVAPEKNSKQFMTKAQWISAGKLFAMYVAFAVLFWLFGFLVAVPIVLFIVTYMLSSLSMKGKSAKQRLLVSLIYGIVGGAVLYLIYVVALDASMPKALILKLLK